MVKLGETRPSQDSGSAGSEFSDAEKKILAYYDGDISEGAVKPILQQLFYEVQNQKPLHYSLEKAVYIVDMEDCVGSIIKVEAEVSRIFFLNEDHTPTGKFAGKVAITDYTLQGPQVLVPGTGGRVSGLSKSKI